MTYEWECPICHKSGKVELSGNLKETGERAIAMIVEAHGDQHPEAVALSYSDPADWRGGIQAA